ncbi:MAG: hypothetical protein JNM22_05490 [Saprospiraceae bacterium]|nr:hypothetical protein [Saprospiraceae bacterium]
MRYVSIALLIFTATVVQAQKLSFGMAVYRTGSDLTHKSINFRSAQGWAFGGWIEQVYKNEVLGMKTSINYMQRRTSFEGLDFQLDVAQLEVMPRLHIQDLDHEWAKLVFGAGLYGQFPKGERPALFKEYDMGMVFELGWDFQAVIVTATMQRSFLDVSVLEKRQNWVSFGIGAQFRMLND